MVRVVPLLFLGYSLQVFFLTKLKTALGGEAIVFLGVSLAAMIALFILHDLRHTVTLFEEHLEIEFLGKKKIIWFHEINKTLITNPGESFSNILIIHEGRKTRLFFVDDAEAVVERMKSKRIEDLAA